ncbi:harmonin-like [Choristoneura fumiferana]|uniref:harmonin-like n=1 Tax=Choristoneura fumiferana TaxID=7141 RepID=UPI003D159449
MYAASTASTTSGSRATAGDRRVRVLRLLRPRRASPAFGFSLRGGREYATGFFVSKVEFNSEAHLQGLKVGDQLVSVNGYRVDDAVHGELVHYLASQSRLKLKVRHVGMVPIKE